MKFTVLGASGVIGRRATAHLRATGHDVETPPRGDATLFSRPLGHVIYAIGLTADFRCRPFDTVEAHVCLLHDVLQRASFESLLYLSSTRVYARADNGREDAVLPVQPQDPSDLYNLSKLLGESLCLSCGRANVRVARLSNVVGGEDENSDNFVPTLVREARAGRIVLQTSPDSAKDYIHIDDVAELLPRIAASGRHRIYNVASGVTTQHAEWVAQLVKLTGCVVEVAPQAPRVDFVLIEVDHIQTEFGFTPRPVLPVLAQALQPLRS